MANERFDMANDQPPPTNPPNPPAQPQPPAPGVPEQQARTWAMWCHLSALAGFVVPFGNVIGPLLVWQIKKNEIPSVEPHGKAALNFQITVAIATWACIILAIILSFVCIGVLFIPVAILVHVAGIVFAIIAGLQANEGKLYTYPYSLKLVT